MRVNTCGATGPGGAWGAAAAARPAPARTPVAPPEATSAPPSPALVRNCRRDEAQVDSPSASFALVGPTCSGMDTANLLRGRGRPCPWAAPLVPFHARRLAVPEQAC